MSSGVYSGSSGSPESVWKSASRSPAVRYRSRQRSFSSLTTPSVPRCSRSSERGSLARGRALVVDAAPSPHVVREGSGDDHSGAALDESSADAPEVLRVVPGEGGIGRQGEVLEGLIRDVLVSVSGQVVLRGIHASSLR